MLFVEPKFFLFFAIVFGAYWLLPTNNARKWLILFASYFFYGSWDWRFAAMLALISSADWWFAVRIAKTPDEEEAGRRRRKLYVTLSLAMNLGVLAYFKYFNFFTESAISLARFAGFHLDDFTAKVLLPVGVSFFTFQSLSYTIDVYRKDIPPVHSLRDYLMFSSFFPQLVAGPIVRPHYFVPQMASKRTLSRPEIKHCLLLFFVGFMKKTCLADNVSPYVDQVFSHPGAYGQGASITAVWLYAVQIFCDFSGYTDMAIAVAGLLGYKLVINFDAPYLASSIRDFWRRWHISLSNWIRDYIYISLGGRSKNRFVTYRNLMITMLAGGLWHGAAWTFVVWGGAHGAAQVVQGEYRHQLPPKPAFSFARKLLGWFLTINFVCVCWVLFRAPDFGTASLIIRRYLLLAGGGAQSLPTWLTFFPLALLLLQWAGRRIHLAERIERLSAPAFAFAYGAFWALAMAFLPLGYRPFIYFQF